MVWFCIQLGCTRVLSPGFWELCHNNPTLKLILAEQAAVYLCEAKSVEAFIQQVAVSYLLHGYFFYVLGHIPAQKDPQATDGKLISRYGLDISKWARARAKKKGKASVQYLRYRRTFVLLATLGQHEFLSLEPTKDIRMEPLRCFGYEISAYQGKYGKWHPSVSIAPRTWREICCSIGKKALQFDASALESCIRKVPFAPFAPVRGQLYSLVRALNRRRKRAALALVSPRCVRRKRKPVRVFEALQRKGGCNGDRHSSSENNTPTPGR